MKYLYLHKQQYNFLAAVYPIALFWSGDWWLSSEPKITPSFFPAKISFYFIYFSNVEAKKGKNAGLGKIVTYLQNMCKLTVAETTPK